MENETTLVVCDTEPVAIAGLGCLLETDGMPRLVSEEPSLEAGMEAVSLLRPSLVVVDKGFGIHPVTEWIRRLRDQYSETHSIVWGSGMSEAEGLRFVQAGASGVVRKTAPLDMVCACLRVVAGGGHWMEDALRHERQRPLEWRAQLTAREIEVMELVEQGLKNREIATILGICTGTVKIHLKHIFEKTGIRGRYGLALTGLKQKGLLAMPAMEMT